MYSLYIIMNNRSLVEYYSQLDPIDKVILNEIQQDSKIPVAELARRVTLSPPAVHARIKRMEDAGIICGYVTIIDREAMGYDMLCFIQVSMQTHNPDVIKEFRAKIAAMPEVLECHQLIGDIDYLLKVVIVNKRDLQRFLMDRITPLPGVARIKTSMVLTEIKSSTILPIDRVEEAPNADH